VQSYKHQKTVAQAVIHKVVATTLSTHTGTSKKAQTLALDFFQTQTQKTHSFGQNEQ
jgi:hypothetical protein